MVDEENQLKESQQQTQKNRKSFLILLAILVILFISTTVLLTYFFSKKANRFLFNKEATQSAETQESTESSTPNTNLVVFNVPIDYWPHDKNPSAIVNIGATKGSKIEYVGDKGESLLFPNRSRLLFGISHAAEAKELYLDNLIPIKNSFYPNIYRYEDGGKMIYSDVTTQGICYSYETLVDNDRCTTSLVDGICQDKETITIHAPCAHPTFHYLIITCESDNKDYSQCDEAMSTIGKINMYIRVEFNIKSVSVSKTIPQQVLGFYSISESELTKTDINNTAVRLQNDDVKIYVISGLGESGGIYDFYPPYSVLTNVHTNTNIARVHSTGDELVFAETVGSSESDRNIYFYTTTFGDSVSCVNSNPNRICSTQEIKLYNQNFDIYCVVGNQEKVSVCDEFVKNLVVEVE